MKNIGNWLFPPALVTGLLLLLTGRTAAQTFTKLHDFAPGGSYSIYYYTNSDGADPNGGLLLAGNALYGTTYVGGTNGNGTIFMVNTGSLSVTCLHAFTAGTLMTLGDYTNADGGNPTAALVLAGDTLYGTARNGGVSGDGTVFALHTDGTGFTNLYTFTATAGGAGLDDTGTNRDGASPLGGLILAGDTLYGTAYLGGTNGNGTVFKVNTDGSGFLTLHHFSAGANNATGVFTNGDGALPFGGVALSGSTLYGTTQEGGRFGYGAVYAIQTDGTGFTNLYQFTDGTDGGQPQANLIVSGGTLYGTAIGAVFKVNTNGTGFASLYNGDDFSAGLILSGDGGTLYGTARVDGGSDGAPYLRWAPISPGSTPCTVSRRPPAPAVSISTAPTAMEISPSAG